MRVVVVGGGIIGLLCAHHLRKLGAEVVVLERDRVGSGCSAGNAGWVTPSISTPLPGPGLRAKTLRWMLHSDSPLYIRPSAAPGMLGWLLRFWKYCNAADFDAGTAAFAVLARDTLALFDELAADGVEFETRSDGLLMAFRDPAEKAEELELLEAIDYGPLRVLDADELRELEPALAGDLAGGIHILPERVVRPEQVCAATAEHLRRHGSRIEENCAVRHLKLDGRRARAATTLTDEIEADAFLIATGAEASRLSTQCGSPLPLQAGKGYSVTIARPETALRYPLYLGSSKIGVTPFARALRVAGTMELSGINLRFDERRVAALKRGAEREIPGVLAGGEAVEWVGMRPITPDGLPILGRLPTCDNVFVATGHQMLGVTLAPSTGKAMAQLIVEGRSEVDLEPFAATRFCRRR
jgi:D-amino-acid dehydrogenase